MKLHLVDATYELYRNYYAMPSILDPQGRQVGAVRGLMQMMLALLRGDDVTHVACAFDHEINSFRNYLFDGYKTGVGVPEDLLPQFELAEEAVSSLGVIVWPMIEFEADDALATAVANWWESEGVEQVVICSPDKDLTQMVRGQKVVCLDRRKGITLDEEGVWAKFGVGPQSIPDYLALVGDSADGIPGVPGWGAKSTAMVLQCYSRLEDIPKDVSQWNVVPRAASTLVENLCKHFEKAILYKRLATLRTDVPLAESLTDLEWRGVKERDFRGLCDTLGFPNMLKLPHRWAD